MALSTITAKTKITASTLNTVINAVNAIQTATPNAYITERWSSGTSWYRRWSDGWIEQGGMVAYTSNISSGKNADMTLTFNTPFNDTKYTLVATSNRSNCYTYEGSPSPYDYQNRFTTATVISFRNVNQSETSTGTKGATWYACGY